MEPERRGSSLEVVLLSLGKLEQSLHDIKETVTTLNQRLLIQNERIGKLEKWQAFMQGSIAVLIIMIVPILINFISSWLKYTFQK